MEKTDKFIDIDFLSRNLFTRGNDAYRGTFFHRPTYTRNWDIKYYTDGGCEKLVVESENAKVVVRGKCKVSTMLKACEVCGIEMDWKL